MNNSPSAAGLGVYFATLSLLTIGGVGAVIPDMHRQFVELNGWMSTTEFAELVALAQTAPGPNILVVSLIGWRLAGVAGALSAIVGICLPSSLLAYGVVHLWQRFQHTRWQKIVRDGLTPVAVGLVLAGGYVLTDAADHSVLAYAITAISVAVVLSTKVHPFLLLGTGALLGYVSGL